MSPFPRFILAVAVFLAPACSDTPTHPAPERIPSVRAEFLVQALTLPSADSLVAVDLNNAGQVLYRLKVGGTWSTWIWKDGRSRLVGEVLGNDINNSGDVVGQRYSNGGGFLWVDGTLTPSPEEAGGVWAINDHGDVAGVAGNHAVVWSGDVVRTLEPQNVCIVHSYPRAINNQRQMVGFGGGCTSSWTLIWRSDLPEILGGGAIGGRSAINEAGYVVGSTTGRGPSPISGVLWKPDGTRVGLGTLFPQPTPPEQWFSARTVEATHPADVNERLEVVGRANIPSGEFHAFLWRDGRIRNLSTLVRGWRIVEAIRINESGQILATAIEDKRSTQEVVLLNPIGP